MMIDVEEIQYEGDTTTILLTNKQAIDFAGVISESIRKVAEAMDKGHDIKGIMIMSVAPLDEPVLRVGLWRFSENIPDKEQAKTIISRRRQ